MTGRLPAALALAVTALPFPARAEAPPSVRVSFAHQAVPLDTGWLVVVLCDAAAVPASGQVAVATEVRCTADGAEASAVAPGGEAVTSLTFPVVGSATVCVYGEAAFLDAVAGHALTASRGPECATLTP
jgi:hypothetical protein